MIGAGINLPAFPFLSYLSSVYTLCLTAEQVFITSFLTVTMPLLTLRMESVMPAAVLQRLKGKMYLPVIQCLSDFRSETSVNCTLLPVLEMDKI